MRMSFGYQQIQMLALICPVCKNHITTENRIESEVTVELFGKRGLSICPSCHQEVTNFKEYNYTRRAKRWLLKHQK